ncbi:MAG TPA: SusC/RagA family TonB-linked outer membrane protein, partial [Anseongella sp.]
MVFSSNQTFIEFMRLTVTTTICIIAVTGSLLGAPVLSGQDLKKTRMTISFDEGRLDQALNHFVEASHLPIAFNPAEMQRYNVPADLRFEDERANIVLEKLLDNLPVTYRETQSGIMIFVQHPRTSDAEPAPVSRSTLQTPEVRGTITDSTGFPMPGVSVTLKNRTSVGTSTDLNGKYILEIPADIQSPVLVFSILGFETQEVPVKGREVVNVVIVESSAQLEDVVVVAFGKQKRTDMVGAVTSVNPSELKVPSSNLTTALAGRMAGMIAYQRSGEPGEDNADFFIRGVTTFGYKVDPLILIDNVEVSTTELARIQPDDIASFSIMKDATATALYGARGANGVILVTTKEGVEGKAKISFRLENSLSTPTRNVDLADPVTYMELHNEAIRTRNPDAPLMYSQSKIENTRNGVDPIVFPATDWRKALFKDYSMNQRFNLNVSGGGKVARYYVAGSMNRDNGVLKVDGRNNFNNNISLTSYTLRSNVNVNLGKLTELVVRLNGNFDDYTGPIEGGKETYNMVMRTNPVLFPAYYPIDEDHSYLRHI